MDAVGEHGGVGGMVCDGNVGIEIHSGHQDSRTCQWGLSICGLQFAPIVKFTEQTSRQ